MSSSTLFFLCFFTIVLGVHALMHYYFWRCMVKKPRFSQSVQRTGTFTVIALFLLLPVSRLAAKYFSFHQVFPLLWLGYLWLGVLMLFIFFFLLADTLNFLFSLARRILHGKVRKSNQNQRFSYARGIALTALLVVLTISAYGIKKCMEPPTVTRLPVTISGLPPSFNGFSIVQISDIHVGAMATKDDLEEIVSIVNDLHPDLIAITGDLVDGSATELASELTPLDKLRAKHGVFFVTGNHEYYSKVDDWLPIIERLGITILNNTRTEIHKGEASLVLAGVTDHNAEKFGKEKAPDFDKALGGIHQARQVILLAHQPRAVEKASQYGVDLVLSGHMHGGQIWPFNYLTPLQQPYLKGFYYYEKTLLYVNQGTEYWGPPMRVGTYKEITNVILN